MDVNVERAEDVLTHKKLLELAHDPANRPACAIRLVQVSFFLKKMFFYFLPFGDLLIGTVIYAFHSWANEGI